MELGEDDGRWMTYAELAKARGIDHQSARRMANRAKWRRQQDNHKVVRVYVPLQAERHRRQRDMSAGMPTDISADTPTDMPAGTSADISRVINAFEGATAAWKAETAALREQLEQANSRADRAEQGRDADRARADALRDRVDSLQSQITALETEGAASDVETAELTAQFRQARCDLQAERTHGEELRKALAEIEERPWWRRWGLLMRR